MSLPGPAAPAPVIEVDRVSTRFGDARVHEGVSLAVLRGEVFALAGGNGSGKSTLLREIVMLQRPTGGAIRLFGTDIASAGEQERDALLRRCGVMFQYGALFSSLTVAENISVPLREHTRLGRRTIREIAEIKIALVGCYQGFRVRGGADAVGRHATISVVQSIFLVIVFDAFFSVAFNWAGL